jgi:hypothetical protein
MTAMSVRQRQDRAAKLRKERAARQKLPPPINVYTDKFAFMTPSAAAAKKGKGIATTGWGGKKGRMSDKIGNKAYPFVLKDNLTTYYPRITPSEIDGQQEPEASHLSKNINEAAVVAGARYAKTLIIPKKARKDTDLSKIEKEIERRIGQQSGNKGAFGAMQAAVGAVFEAATFAALGLQEPSVGKEKGDFDVRGITKQKNVRDLFNIKNQAIDRGDLKVSASEGNIKSFITKIIKEVGSYKKYDDALDALKNPQATPKKKGKAAGFIPNYNRRKGYGVPASQVRVHLDKERKPFAVTNTGDERPNSFAENAALQDAIGREKKGIGMYAAGFIPNYGGFNPAEMREATSGGRERKKLEKETKKATGRMVGFTSALFGVQMGIQMLGERARGLNAEFQATHDQKKEEIMNSDLFITEQLRLIESSRRQAEAMEESNKSFISLADGAQVAFTAMMSLGAIGSLVPQGARDWAVSGIAAGASGLNAKLLKAGPLLSTGAGKLLGAAGILTAAALSISNAVDEWQHANRAGISDRQRGTEKGAAVGGMLGQGIGGAVGALAGVKGAAAIGAAMGTTIAPIIGTVIGAGIGILLGDLIGSGVGGAVGGSGKSDVAPDTPQAAASGEAIKAVMHQLADLFRDRKNIGRNAAGRRELLEESVMDRLEDKEKRARQRLTKAIEAAAEAQKFAEGGDTGEGEVKRARQALAAAIATRVKFEGGDDKVRDEMEADGEITHVLNEARKDYADTVEAASGELFEFVGEQKGGKEKIAQINKALKDYNDVIVAISLKEKQAADDPNADRRKDVLERLGRQRAEADKNVTARVKELSGITHETLDLTISYNKAIEEATKALSGWSQDEDGTWRKRGVSQKDVLEDTFDARQKGSRAAQVMAAQASLVVPAGPASETISMLNTQAAGKANVQSQLSAVRDIMANLKAAQGVDAKTSDPAKVKALGEELATAEGKLADAISKLNSDLNNNITQLEGAIKAQKGLVERSGGEGIRVAAEAKKRAEGFVAEGLDLDALSASLNKIGELSSKGRQDAAADELSRMHSIAKPFVDMFGQAKVDEFTGKKIGEAGGDIKAIIAAISQDIVSGGDAGDADFFGKSLAETQTQAITDNTIKLEALTTALTETRAELGIDATGEKVEPKKGSFADMLGGVPQRVMDMTTDVTAMRESTKKIIEGLKDGSKSMQDLVEANKAVTEAATRAFEKATKTIADYDIILEGVMTEVDDIKKDFRGRADALKAEE